ncbi:uncharacterized protein F5147DRAFT_777065 [Suillus discolor]|uniref:Uncharacterized protein n=1 Tax=Suillus discolor TaxID=1912936 RepID=A0A9P7JQU7_9AGAM|nr:uncharacterized protein F5147DRAFT_777065 [Suillus discolor]KAG2100160.1 hypothetical protein F5147DRAFT_777065 [Suillus discolor]
MVYRPHFFLTSSQIFSSVVYATALFRPTWQTTMSTTPVNPLPTFALPPSHLLSSSTWYDNTGVYKNTRNSVAM